MTSSFSVSMLQPGSTKSPALVISDAAAAVMRASSSDEDGDLLHNGIVPHWLVVKAFQRTMKLCKDEGFFNDTKPRFYEVRKEAPSVVGAVERARKRNRLPDGDDKGFSSGWKKHKGCKSNAPTLSSSSICDGKKCEMDTSDLASTAVYQGNNAVDGKESIDFAALLQCITTASSLCLSEQDGNGYDCCSVCNISDDDCSELFNTYVFNDGHESIVRRWRFASYQAISLTFPPHCAFLMSDVRRIQPLLRNDPHQHRFDLILADPPWRNKSAHRKSTYGTLPNRLLKKHLHLRRFCREGKKGENVSLVAVWVTNSPSNQAFVANEWFPSSKITLIAQWYWWKIMPLSSISSAADDCHSDGEGTGASQCLPFDMTVELPTLSSSRKKGYEVIMIGSYNTSATTPEDIRRELGDLPQLSIVCAPASAYHSQKPSIEDLLLRHVKSEVPRCLELFARCLRRGWTSWELYCGLMEASLEHG